MLFSYLERKKDGWRDRAIRHAQGPHAVRWLALLSFAEASFFPIPPDVLLIAILLGNKGQRWAFYAAITTVFSVLGGIFGYAIGFFLFAAVGAPLLNVLHVGGYVDGVRQAFQAHAFLTIFTAAFTPIPYKVFTIVAGLFHISMTMLIAASVAGRGIRFFAVAYLSKRYGTYIGDILYKYFNILSLLIVAVLILIAFFV